LNPPILGEVNSFSVLFEYIVQLSYEQNITLIIDEFQEFFTVNPSVYSDMQRIWDLHKDKAKLNLIVSGSVISLMYKIFENYKEPLFGRANHFIKLQAFKTNTLKEILSFADNFDETKTATMLRNELAKEKLFPSNKDEVTGLLETLGICGILETKEHRGFWDSFTPMFERDSGDLRQYFSYPFHWWKGKDRVNYENVKNIFKITV